MRVGVEGTWSFVVVVSLNMRRSERMNGYFSLFTVIRNDKWRPCRGSQILMVPSSLPVTSHLPSLWNETAVMLEVWPSNVISWEDEHEGGYGNPGMGCRRTGVEEELPTS